MITCDTSTIAYEVWVRMPVGTRMLRCNTTQNQESHPIVVVCRQWANAATGWVSSKPDALAEFRVRQLRMLFWLE
jgi:hypothetical protein